MLLNRNAHFAVVMDERRNTDPAVCPDPVPGRRLLAEPDPPSSHRMFSLMASVLTATVLGSLASGLAFLYTVRHQSLLLIKLALAIQARAVLSDAGCCLAEMCTLRDR